MSETPKQHSTLKEKLAAAVMAQQGYYTENKVLKRKVRDLEEQLEAAQDALRKIERLDDGRGSTIAQMALASGSAEAVR